MRSTWFAVGIAVLGGCAHDGDVDAAAHARVRSELRALSSENAWLHARLARLEATPSSTACAVVEVDPTPVLRDVRRALAAEIAAGRVDVGLLDGAVGVPLGVGFEGDSAVLTPEGDVALQRLAGTLRRSPGVGVEVVTEVVGAPVIAREDWDRAHARALAIAWALSDLGVPGDRIAVVTRPVTAVPSGPPATDTTPRRASVQVVLRPGVPGAPEERGPVLGVVR